jgi:hypothetical protein
MELDQKIPLTIQLGYGFLFSPPAKYYQGKYEDPVAPSIALSQLCVQWVVVAIGVGGILIVLRGSQKEKP